jgi:UDP-N-acetylglucosamine--N-acetylmuramyl-(pentapeptide) pyrophosphoryl-undecaprenol N-acetylglucosamine transferase
VKIIVTGGGTAGHITPLLAVVSEIASQNPSAQIRYIGQYGDKFSKQMVGSDQNISRQSRIFAGKFRRFHGRGILWYLGHPSLILRNFRDFFYVIVGIVQSLFLLTFWRPDVVFVKGGYVGLPVGIGAGLLMIPVVTHDSDAIPGLTNRVVSKFAKKMAVAMPAQTYANFYSLDKVVETGVPVREDFIKGVMGKSANKTKASLGLKPNESLLTVVGGSLGAIRLNNAFLHSLPYILNENSNLRIYWATGKSQYKEINQKIGKDKLLSSRVEVRPFFDNLADIFISSDLVVSRSGATTLAELAIVGTPTILVPNPVLTGGHQSINARVYTAKKACITVEENEIEQDPSRLGYIINDVINNDTKLNSLSNNISSFAHPKASADLARLIINVGSK